MIDTGYTIPKPLIGEQNRRVETELKSDYESLGEQLARRDILIDEIVRSAERFEVAIPSWGVGTGGTRFARFPGPGEPRNIYEKLVDCATIHQLTRSAPRVSLHIPWDKPSDMKGLRELASSLELGFDAMNSNTFQDQEDQPLSYKCGSLSHVDPSVRAQAVQHNIECISIGKTIGSKALTVWIADGGNFPGQLDFRRSLERYLSSMTEIYTVLPADWKILIEYKCFEPAFYSTVINDWGVAYLVSQRLGSKALCLVDLGHHAPNANIEKIVAHLIQFEKLGGFHFNDSKYGDDDLDSGSINPFQLFLVFQELVAASRDSQVKNFSPAYMIDQSHNITDPVESLISSVEQLQRAYVQALLVDQTALNEYRESNDALMAMRVLKDAFQTDVTPIVRKARVNRGGAHDPLAVFRVSKYREAKSKERPSIPAPPARSI